MQSMSFLAPFFHAEWSETAVLLHMHTFEYGPTFMRFRAACKKAKKAKTTGSNNQN